MEFVKNIFRGYTREEVYAIVKDRMETAEKKRFMYGGFWIVGLGASETVAEYLHDALEKYMRVPYTYHRIPEQGWRVNIVHMPK